MRQLMDKMMKRQFRSGGFIASIVTVVICMIILPAVYGSGGIPTLGVFIGIGITLTLVLGWGSTVSSIKNSSVMRIVQTSNITKYKFMAYSLIPALAMFAVTATILVTLALILVSTGFVDAYRLDVFAPEWNQNQGLLTYLVTIGYDRNEIVYYTSQEAMAGINWLMFMGGVILAGITSTAMSFFMVSTISTPAKYNTFAWIYAVMILLFAGGTAPISLIRGDYGEHANASLSFFRYVSFALPTSYTNFLISDGLSWVQQETIVNAQLVADINAYSQGIWIDGSYYGTAVGKEIPSDYAFEIGYLNNIYEIDAILNWVMPSLYTVGLTGFGTFQMRKWN